MDEKEVFEKSLKLFEEFARDFFAKEGSNVITTMTINDSRVYFELEKEI